MGGLVLVDLTSLRHMAHCDILIYNFKVFITI
jgi:hypothetical protein